MKLTINKDQPTMQEKPIACGSLYIIIGYDTDGRIRFFFQVSHKGGGCQANLTGLAKCLTLVFNDGRLNQARFIEELEEITCPACGRWKGKMIGQGKSVEGLPSSCPNAIASVLKDFDIIKDDKK